MIGIQVSRIGLLLLVLLLAGCEKHRLDEQVKELCAKDGGVKVYETVTLPKEVFTEYGDLKFYRATQGENALGPEYIFVTEITEIKSGNPNLKRIALPNCQARRRRHTGRIGVSTLVAVGTCLAHGTAHPFSAPPQTSARAF